MADESGPNEVKGAVTVNIGNKEWPVIFSLNAMVAIEEKSGKSLIKGDFFDFSSAKEIRTLLWAAIMDNDPELLTEEYVGRNIGVNNFLEVSQALQRALEVAMPTADANANPTNRAQRRQNRQAG